MNKKKQHDQYKLPEQAFDAFDKEASTKDALGSRRIKARQEAADIRSTNWNPGVSGWRLTPSGIEIGSPNFTIPVQVSASVTLSYVAGTLTATTIGASGTFSSQDGKIIVVLNGLVVSITNSSASTSVSPSTSLSPSASPSVSPSVSLSPSLSPSISPSVSPS